MKALVVIHPHNGRGVGEHITNLQEIEMTLGGEHAGNVVQVELPDEVPPAPPVVAKKKTVTKEFTDD